MILRSERIDAGVHTDVANEKLWTLHKVRYLIEGSFAETAYGVRHRSSP